MWDIVTPIVVAGKHVGNLFLGQFFFGEEEYLSAVDRVPRWSEKTIDAVMVFFTRLTGVISELSRHNLELARILAERDNLLRSLRESEEKYRALAENAGEVIYVAQDGTISFANTRASEFLGCSREEFTAWPLAEIVHSDDRAAVVERHFQRL